MASKRRLHWKECLKKKRYGTSADARRKAIEIGEKLGFPMKRYWCHWCKGYHIAHARRPDYREGRI